MKYTPGPWVVDPNVSSAVYPFNICQKDARPFGDEKEGQFIIAKILQFGDGLSNQDEANANLVAAAPELLAVAEKMVRLIYDMVLAGEMKNTKRVADLNNTLDEIINKAKGE